MSIPTLPEITSKTIETPRITTRVLFSGPEDGTPVLFLHGNVSSATWWEEALVSLPAGYRGIAPDQRGFGDADPAAKTDATRGMGDMTEDALALMTQLGYDRFHVVGNSLGGNVVWRMMMDAPGRLISVTQVAPGSPYGFGGTRGLDGTPCFPDFAGSGGGLSNPELIKRMQHNDMSSDSPFSPRSAIRTLLVKPGFIPAREDELVASLNATHIGEQDVPGDSTPSANWPHMAPGQWGATNALSPKYAGDIQALVTADPKPPVLWIRGSHDLVVSDTAAADPGFLGQHGLLPGWPGVDVFPPQPMLGQTRAVLEKYAGAGGWFKEIVIMDTAHLPWLEKPEEFNRHFHAHLNR